MVGVVRRLLLPKPLGKAENDAAVFFLVRCNASSYTSDATWPEITRLGVTSVGTRWYSCVTAAWEHGTSSRNIR